MKQVYEMISMLCKLSDRQLDKQIKDKLKELIDKPKEVVKVEILKCIDDCQMYSLSSSFEIGAMKAMYEDMLNGSSNDYGCAIRCDVINTKK